jgi:hypothetical protein
MDVERCWGRKKSERIRLAREELGDLAKEGEGERRQMRRWGDM